MNELRGITLRTVSETDLPVILNLFGDVDRAHLWGHRRVCDEAQLFETWRYWSHERMGDKFMILSQGRPVGLVFDYERALEDGHTKVATMLLENCCGQGAGVIATALFSQWLFQNLPVRKLYLDVFEFNEPVLRMLNKLGLHEEMKRVEHRYWNGRYWDQYGFAFYRDDLTNLIERLSGRRTVTRNTTHLPAAKLPRQETITPVATSATNPNSNGHVVDQALTSLVHGA